MPLVCRKRHRLITAQTASSETETWLEQARSLAPVIDKFRDEAERERQLPQPIFEAIRDAGLLSLVVPRTLGGPQVSLETFFRVIEELSRSDGSVGWNAFIGAGSGFFADYMAGAAAAEVFGQANSIISGALGGSARAVPVEGGFRVTGRWPFASGCHNANWLIGGCLIFENGGPRMLPNGAPEIIDAIWP